MDINSKLVKKYFNFIIDVFFILSVVILLSQVIGRGLKFEDQKIYNIWLSVLNLVFSIFSIFTAYYLLKIKKTLWIGIIRFLFLFISLFYFFNTIENLISINFFNLPIKDIEISLSIFIAFLSFSCKISGLVQTNLHPSVLFILSFAMIIFLGSFLLILPASTTKEINYIDSLFISTSAVTVTGLSTLSIENNFTRFGQIILLILIQLGGFGVLTFSNLFALLFNSESSFKNRILIGRMINESNSSNIFKTLFKIFTFTLFIELAGSILIFSFIDKKYIQHPLFFSIFHSISAFCNAGFSTLDQQFYNPIFKFNHGLHLIIASLLITGGLGYNIIINYYFIIKIKLLKLINFICKTKIPIDIAIHRTNINTLMVIRTTLILIIIGTLLFFILEYNNTLRQYNSFFEKLLISFFNSVTPRTAGFININFTEILLPTSLFISFLMWIGASPGSTGGGIKTTTFAIGIMGLFNHIKGKDRITINWKEIPNTTLNLVNSTIILSIFTIGVGTFCMTIFEEDMSLKNLFFEVVSAYSTVGLSLGITPYFSISSKIVLIIIMFLGRVGFITFLIGMYRQFFREEHQQNRIYPKEKVYV